MVMNMYFNTLSPVLMTKNDPTLCLSNYFTLIEPFPTPYYLLIKVGEHEICRFTQLESQSVFEWIDGDCMHARSLDI